MTRVDRKFSVTAVPLFIPTLQTTLNQVTNEVQLSWDDENNSCSYSIHASSAPYFTPDGTNILVLLGAGATSYNVPVGTSSKFYTIQPTSCGSGTATGASGTVGISIFSIAAGS